MTEFEVSFIEQVFSRQLMSLPTERREDERHLHRRG